MTPRTRASWFPKRGEIYWMALDKRRPAAILSVNALNKFALDVCVVPLTTVARRRFSLRVPIHPPDGGLRMACWAKCDQVTTLEKRNLVLPAVGILSATTMKAIEDGVRIALGLTEV